MKVIVGNEEKISALIAEEFIKVVNKKENAVLGLATGTSPLKVYADLAKANECAGTIQYGPFISTKDLASNDFGSIMQL